MIESKLCKEVNYWKDKAEDLQESALEHSTRAESREIERKSASLAL